jgi:hypothetical protein
MPHEATLPQGAWLFLWGQHMGMIAGFYTLGDSNIGRKKPPPAAVENLVLAEGEAMNTDIDKAWHGIHYLLTKTDWGGE